VTSKARQWPRRHATVAAGVTALVVFAVAVALLLSARSKPPGDAGPGKVTTTTQTTAAAGQPPATVTTTTERTTVGPDRSLIGRALGLGAGPYLLQTLLAALVAFASGAIVQRVILGEYGVTVGPVSLPALPPVTEEATLAALEGVAEAPEIAEISLPSERHVQTPPLYTRLEEPRLGLVSIRIDLETRLRALSDALGVDPEVPLVRLPERLMAMRKLSPEAARGIVELLRIGDRIVAGADVDEGAADRLRSETKTVMYALDELTLRAAGLAAHPD